MRINASLPKDEGSERPTEKIISSGIIRADTM